MEQNYISKPTKLLNKKTLATRGYSTHFNFIYNKKDCKSRRLKEWDFYQIVSGYTVVQLTIGHVSYLGQVSATILDLKTGERRTMGKILLRPRKLKNSMPQNPETPNVLQWFGKNIKIRFETTDKFRRLTLTELSKQSVRTEIDLILTNSDFSKEKMVIATPFYKPKMWYLNYKENCFVVNGYCRIEDMAVEIVDGNAVLDWGRGVWPRKHKWVWGNGSTMVNGKFFGFNIGWGFGDTSQATENMFFYDNKAYKLGDVYEVKIGDSFRYSDKDKKFVFTASQLFDNYTETKAVVVNNNCHQYFGLWQGYVEMPDGTRMEIPPFVAFCEHADNSW